MGLLSWFESIQSFSKAVNLVFFCTLADIFDLFESSKSPIKYECVGGGRIEVEQHNKKIKIFGYSQGFGRADHEMSCDLVRKKYKDYEVTWSNDGY